MLETKSVVPSNYSFYVVKTGRRENNTTRKFPNLQLNVGFVVRGTSQEFDGLEIRDALFVIKKTVCRTRGSLRSKPTKHPHQYQDKYVKSIYAALARSIAYKIRYVKLLVNGVHI